jgi:hypothetical protein
MHESTFKKGSSLSEFNIIELTIFLIIIDYRLSMNQTPLNLENMKVQSLLQTISKAIEKGFCISDIRPNIKSGISKWLVRVASKKWRNQVLHIMHLYARKEN